MNNGFESCQKTESLALKNTVKQTKMCPLTFIFSKTESLHVILYIYIWGETNHFSSVRIRLANFMYFPKELNSEICQKELKFRFENNLHFQIAVYI